MIWLASLRCGSLAASLRRQKLGAIAALAVFGVAPVLGIVHLCLVEHSTCPVDGELVEAAPGITHGADVAIPGLRASPAQPAQENHDHHHCAAATRRASQAGRAASTKDRTVIQAADPGRIVVRFARPIASTPLLLVAPKASPPAAC